MARIKNIALASILLASIVLIGCAVEPIRTFRPIKTVELNYLMGSEAYRQKAENIYILLDGSLSMKEAYHGNAFAGDDFPGDAKPTKFAVASEILQRMNSSMEGFKINTAIRRFGFGPCLGWGLSRLDYPLAIHDYDQWLSSLGHQECLSGGSTLTNSLEDVLSDLESVSGRTALIIVSDGKNYTSSPVPAAEALKARFGKSICIYTVWLGNPSDASGQKTLKKISEIGDCGLSTTSKAIYPATGFDRFMTSVVFDSHVQDQSD